MAFSWFLYIDNVVVGPLSTNDVQLRVQSGIVSPHSYIWWKGQGEWMQVRHWIEKLPEILRAADSAPNRGSVWYLDLNGSRLGPITQTELIEHLRTIAELSAVRLWAVGMPNWTTVFQLQSIMVAIGLSRREMDRAPLMGQVSLSRTSDDPRHFDLSAASISVGGIGLTGIHDLYKGDEVSLTLNCAELDSDIPAVGRVLYTAKSGYVGILFKDTPSDLKQIVSRYVDRFSGDEKRIAA